MRARLLQRLDFRIALTMVFAIWFGINNASLDVATSMHPYTGFVVGLVAGVMLASWWALAVAPGGFTLGLAITHVIGVGNVPFAWSDWAVIMVLSLVFVVPGVYIGRWASGAPQRAGAGDTG